jgi:MPBQ/MSBQ methyltransferase
MDTRDAWESEYGRKGNVWSGAPFPLPDLPSGTRVLELGCGNGKNLVPMARRGWDVTGIDIAPTALAHTRDALRREGLKALLVEGDMCGMPFVDGAFGRVFAVHALDHVDARGRMRALDEVRRVLGVGGRLYLRAFGTGDMRCGAGEEVEPGTYLRGTGIATHYFDEAEVRALLREFSSVRVWSEERERSVGAGKARRQWILAECGR